MALRVSKDSIDLRKKLSELERPIGLKGNELMRSDTAQDARDLVSADRKNIIINGAMQVNQRYGFNNPQTANNERHIDRFIVRDNTGGTLQVRQNAPGSPFYNALQLNVTGTDTSLSNNDYARVQYLIEGYDLRGIDWGQTNSKDYLTLSFWVKTNAIGDYHVNIENTSNYYFPLMVRKYTISKADEWTKIVVTYPSPGTYSFERGNGRGMAITWALSIGGSYNQATDGVWRGSGYQMSTPSQRNFMDTSGNYFYLTGVQLEKGKNATDFEHRSYGEELALCQRYYQNSYHQSDGKYPGNTDNDNGMIQTCWSDGNSPFGMFPTPMRAQPSVTLRQRGTNNTGKVEVGGSQKTAAAYQITNQGVGYIGVSSGVAGSWCAFTYELTAEL